MTCKDLKRLTISDAHKAKSNTERLMNFAYAKDNRVFIPQPYKDDIDLCEYVSKLTKVKGCNFPPEEIMEGACLECDRDCEIGILYYCAVQAAELRECLKMFEDKLENGTLIELPCKVGETLYVIDDRFEGLPQDVIKRLGKGNHSYKIECYEKITYGTLLRLLIEKNKNSEQGYLMLFFTSKSEAEQKLKELQE